MKISKKLKTTFVAVAMVAGSLGTMSFTNVADGLCVKQQITLTDGRTITAYLVQQGNTYSLYTTADVNKYSPNDLGKIKDCQMTISTGYEGNRIAHANSLQEAVDMANAIFKLCAGAK